MVTTYRVPDLCYICLAPAEHDVKLTTNVNMGASYQVYQMTLRVCQPCEARREVATVGLAIFFIVMALGLLASGLGAAITGPPQTTHPANPVLYLPSILLLLLGTLSGGFRQLLKKLWLGIVDRHSHRIPTSQWVDWATYDIRTRSFGNPEFARAFHKLNPS